MSIIDELMAKLKSAERALNKAQALADEAGAEAAARRKDVTAWMARVDELTRAVALLRNGLKVPVVQVGGNVTPLKPS